MDLVEVAFETVRIVAQGRYVGPSGRRVDVGEAVARAVAGTVLVRPDEAAALAAMQHGRAGDGPARIEVTGETTTQAARRLVEREGETRVAALNFASARHPGGGFLSGARAQEEDLCRKSALYACLERQEAYYEANRAFPSALYTDHVIVSPAVPFFRDEELALLDAPYAASVVTAPAPNAGDLRDETTADVEATFHDRTRKVLAVAAAHGYRALVLGAWGCGAFRNDPRLVADAWAGALADARFAGAFERIVFAVWDPDPKHGNRLTFAARFGRPSF